MTIPDLARDEVLRQREFPVCRDKVFLAHAGVSPLPRCVAAAMEQYLEAATAAGQEDVLADQFIRETRCLAAELIDAKPDEIAFTSSTSMGLAMVAAGLDWQPGDNVVCYRDDYPANVYPWMGLARRGVETRFVQPVRYGNVTVADVARTIDRQTRLVALASVHFVTGWRLDVDVIGRMLRDRGILFCLDGIQSFGALRTSVRHVDFAAADAHKWLLGPLGAAILYVRREKQELLTPALIGWNSAPCPGFIARDRLEYWPSARRYEPGSLNLVGIVGLHAALQMLQRFGLRAVEQRVLESGRIIGAGICARGFQLAGPVAETDLSGIVSFSSSVRDAAGMHQALAQHNVITSLRQTRAGHRVLRLSPHFYNTEAELNRVLEFL